MKFHNAFKCLTLASCAALLGCPPSSAPMAQIASIANATSANLAAVQTGTAVAIVLDTSGSMGAGNKLDAAKHVFRDIIYPRLAAARDPVEYSIITCGGSPNVLRNNQLVAGNEATAVDGLCANGGTPLGESILAAYAELSKSHREDKYIFILSDGAATGIAPELIIGPFQEQGVRVNIFVIGFQSDASYYTAMVALGGQLMMVEDENALNSTCDALFKKILKVEAE